MKQDLSVTIRCIPFDSPDEAGTCIYCGAKSDPAGPVCKSILTLRQSTGRGKRDQMIRITDILDKIYEYSPDADVSLIDRAYIYSARGS